MSHWHISWALLPSPLCVVWILICHCYVWLPPSNLSPWSLPMKWFSSNHSHNCSCLCICRSKYFPTSGPRIPIRLNIKIFPVHSKKCDDSLTLLNFNLSNLLNLIWPSPFGLRGTDKRLFSPRLHAQNMYAHTYIHIYTYTHTHVDMCRPTNARTPTHWVNSEPHTYAHTYLTLFTTTPKVHCVT